MSEATSSVNHVLQPPAGIGPSSIRPERHSASRDHAVVGPAAQGVQRDPETSGVSRCREDHDLGGAGHGQDHLRRVKEGHDIMPRPWRTLSGPNLSCIGSRTATNPST